MSEPRFWRVRMKYTGDKDNKDNSEEAWNRDEVGIWYGAWSHKDFEIACKHNPLHPEDELNKVEEQKNIIAWTVSAGTVKMARAFKEIRDPDWVVVCFGENISIGKLNGPLLSSPDHPLNRRVNKSGALELWKYRKVSDKMTFNLAALPDIYMLIPQAGRRNIYTLPTYARALRLLADCRSEKSVREKFESMCEPDRLDFLGPGSWESFCLGYLILEQGFLPTGLDVGRTLEGFDIVGRSNSSGRQILAQCKKDEDLKEVAESFVRKIQKYGDKVDPYYFAYRGCSDTANLPLLIQKGILTKDHMLQWVQSEPGKSFFRNFFVKSDHQV